MRSDISATVFLSDPADYDGGELVIEGTLGAERVKHAAGDLIVYPGSTLHHVTPVTRGTRYAAFFWTQSSSVPTNSAARCSTSTPRSSRSAVDHPDHRAIDALTGVYHNLLRHWAET